MTRLERWQRLADTLNRDETLSVTVYTKPRGTFAPARRESESYGIVIRTGSGTVDVRDTWWRDNWTGYSVTRENADSIVTFERSRLKSRTAVVDAVKEALS